MTDRLVTAREAAAWFCIEAISRSDATLYHGFPSQAVYAVLSGKSRCSRQHHRIAVALRIRRYSLARRSESRLSNGTAGAVPRAIAGCKSEEEAS